MKRLLEDAQLSLDLRGDLQRARASGHDYPATAKLLQLRAALLDRTARRFDTLGAAPRPALHAGWKLAALALLGGGAALIAQPRTPAPPPAAHVSTRAAAPGHANAPPTAASKSSPRPANAPASGPVTAAAPAATPATAPAVATAAAPATATVAAPATAHAAVPATAHATGNATARAIVPANAPATKIATVPAADHAVAPAADHAVAPAADHADEASSSRREIAQLVRVRALLLRNPPAARRLAERSEREFPRGLLSEERRALAIVALARMGSMPLAEKEARRYFADYPHSPMRGLIEAALHR